MYGFECMVEGGVCKWGEDGVRIRIGGGRIGVDKDLICVCEC